MKMTAAASVAALFASSGLLSQAPCFETSFGTNLNLTGDDTGVAVALGFPFTFNGVPYTDINVCTNGFVWLGLTPPATTPWDYSPTEAELLTIQPRIAPCWMDLYPPSGGNIWFNTFPASPGVPARAVVTWDQVPQIGNTSCLMTLQLQLMADNSFQWSIDGTSLPTNVNLVGCSEGGSAISFPVDFSTTPINSGQFPTLHETFAASTNDLVGRTFQALPNGTNGYIVLELPHCRHAQTHVYGSGCPVQVGSAAYELFANGTFDLSNSSLLFVPSPNGSYAVLPGTNTWFTGFSNNLALTDDSVSSVTLPWSFPHAGGSTSTITVVSNGYVWLGSSTNTDYTPSNTELLSDPLGRIALMWMDLNPGVGGGVFADLDTATGEYVVTWNAVPEYSNVTNLITMQLALQANGIFELRFQVNTNGTHAAMTAYSQGGVPNDPGSSDFSVLPITTPTPQPLPPLVLAPQGTSKPQIGTTFVAEISNVPASSQVGVLLVSFVRASLDLTPFGMPGCSAYVDLLNNSKLFVPVLSSVVPVSLPVPNSTSLVGLSVYTQAAVVAAAVNAVGLAASNGLELDLGL